MALNRPRGLGKARQYTLVLKVDMLGMAHTRFDMYDTFAQGDRGRTALSA
jgi:hypothetical protein